MKDSCVPSLTHTINSFRHQANTPVPNLPFPIHGTGSGAPSLPLPTLVLCVAKVAYVARAL